MGLSSGAPEGQAGATRRRQGMQAMGEFPLQDRPPPGQPLSVPVVLCVSSAFRSQCLSLTAAVLSLCLSVCLYPFACHPASLSVSSWPCASLSLRGAVSLSARIYLSGSLFCSVSLFLCGSFPFFLSLSTPFSLSLHTEVCLGWWWGPISVPGPPSARPLKPTRSSPEAFSLGPWELLQLGGWLVPLQGRPAWCSDLCRVGTGAWGGHGACQDANLGQCSPGVLRGERLPHKPDRLTPRVGRLGSESFDSFLLWLLLGDVEHNTWFRSESILSAHL